MVRSISVRLLVSDPLLELAETEFSRLMKHPDHREDALQEIRMVETFVLGQPFPQKRDALRRALAWLGFELGVESRRPRGRRPSYVPLPIIEEGTFLSDLAERLEVARAIERAAA